jgi:predicted RNA binding protein YcfA (HicA-like mRNA interferase family)
MKLPRSVSGAGVIRALERLGYERVRQKGSHVRLRHRGPPAHSISVPLYDPLKTGTLHGIVTEVVAMRSMSVEDFAELL